MSMEPIQRQMTNPIAGVVGQPALLQDNITLLSFIQLNIPNTILDMYNSPDPAAATDFYQYELQKNSISTGRNFFSTAMSTASAGRAAVGPVRLASGQLQMQGTPVGALAPINDQNIVIKFSNGF
tara:strand:+ start:512 stop:886 length:375 start_codon:yes stop_codon:yes gene_type:complete